MGKPPKKVDREVPTPRVSGSFSAFYDESTKIAEKLATQESMVAATLRARALALAHAFAGWPENPPDVEERSTTIQRLVDLNGYVHALLGADEIMKSLNAHTPHAQHDSPIAVALYERAVELKHRLVMWNDDPPDDDERNDAIHRLGELKSQVHAFLNRER